MKYRIFKTVTGHYAEIYNKKGIMIATTPNYIDRADTVFYAQRYIERRAYREKFNLPYHYFDVC